jgi:hypothetical protein
MEVVSYNLDSYKDIVFSGFDYKLPTIILDTIQKLTSELGVSNVSPTNNSKTADSVPFKTFTNTKRGGFGNKRNKFPEDETWEKAKPFKTTQLEKKEGTEKLINDIEKNLVTKKDCAVEFYTIHSYKGLEDDIIRIFNDIDIKNEQNLYYVALTRGRKRIILDTKKHIYDKNQTIFLVENNEIMKL